MGDSGLRAALLETIAGLMATDQVSHCPLWCTPLSVNLGPIVVAVPMMSQFLKRDTCFRYGFNYCEAVIFFFALGFLGLHFILLGMPQANQLQELLDFLSINPCVVLTCLALSVVPGG